MTPNTASAAPPQSSTRPSVDRGPSTKRTPMASRNAAPPNSAMKRPSTGRTDRARVRTVPLLSHGGHIGRRPAAHPLPGRSQAAPRAVGGLHGVVAGAALAEPPTLPSSQLGRGSGGDTV